MALTNDRPPLIGDELTWELVRDEWELLLAIGSGPTSVEAAAAALGEGAAAVRSRIELLVEHRLVAQREGGYGLVSAFYERREGMSSYLRDLVVRQIDNCNAPPIAGAVRGDLGGPEQVAALLRRAEETLYSRVVDAASRPESPRSERFSIFFAAASCPVMPAPAEAGEFLPQLLRVLRAAAESRAQDPNDTSSYLWIAEMRADPEVAVEIGEIFEEFVTSAPCGSGAGAAGFAIVPSSRAAMGAGKR